MQRLKSSLGPTGFSPGLHDQNDVFTVSIFFDSGGRLQQVSAYEKSGERLGGWGAHWEVWINNSRAVEA